MTLTTAMNSAKSVFSNTGEQSSVVSKNIANSGNTNYVKRYTNIVTTTDGATVVSIGRSENLIMQKQMLASNSDSAGQDALLDGLERLKSVLGGNDYELSPSTYMAQLYDDLQAYAAKPGEISLAQTAVSSAQDVANSLNKTTTAVQDVREQADLDISNSVTDLNALLANLQKVNDQIVSLTSTGGDANDYLDQRDGIVSEISSIVGVTVQTRSNNDLVLYTSDGTTLFETIPRTVTFQAQTVYDAGTVGNSVYIDGTAVKFGSGGDTSAQGTIAANLQLRDEIAPTFQNQLDEVARGLITVFDDSGVPGLFAWSDPSSGVTLPGDPLPSATIYQGLAGLISVNSDYVSSAGGDPTRLRDGNSTDMNPSDNAGYTDLLTGYMDAMSASMDFDPESELDESTSLLNFSTDSVGWLEEYRSNATSASEKKTAMLQRAQQAYSSETGVSLDEELALLLDIEQSYKAASKLLSTVDEMMQSLLTAVG